MPQPVANTPSARSSQGYYTVGQGFSIQPTNTTLTTANVPNDNATSLIGADAVQFTIPPVGHVSLLFPNLPVRNNKVNPLNPFLVSQTPFTVLAQDSLIFFAIPQGGTTPVECKPYGQINAYSQAPGPFLGSGTYTGFGVTITGAEGTTGTIFAMLIMQRGSS